VGEGGFPVECRFLWLNGFRFHQWDLGDILGHQFVNRYAYEAGHLFDQIARWEDEPRDHLAHKAREGQTGMAKLIGEKPEILNDARHVHFRLPWIEEILAGHLKVVSDFLDEVRGPGIFAREEIINDMLRNRTSLGRLTNRKSPREKQVSEVFRNHLARLVLVVGHEMWAGLRPIPVQMRPDSGVEPSQSLASIPAVQGIANVEDRLQNGLGDLGFSRKDVLDRLLDQRFGQRNPFGDLNIDAGEHLDFGPNLAQMPTAGHPVMFEQRLPMVFVEQELCDRGNVHAVLD